MILQAVMQENMILTLIGILFFVDHASWYDPCK